MRPFHQLGRTTHAYQVSNHPTRAFSWHQSSSGVMKEMTRLGLGVAQRQLQSSSFPAKHTQQIVNPKERLRFRQWSVLKHHDSNGRHNIPTGVLQQYIAVTRTP